MLTGVALVAILAAGMAAAQQPPEDAAAAVDQALERFDAGELEAAIGLLEPLAGLAETPPQLRAVLGALYLEAGRSAEALALLEPMAAAEGADPAVLYNAARAALAEGRFEEAESWLTRSARLAPGSPAARELGLLRGRQGRLQEAFVLLRPWIADHPDDEEARLAAALCAVQMERAPEAEELLSDLPQDNPRVRLLWGKTLLLKGDPYGALATLKPLLESGADEQLEMDVRRSMSQAYVLTGQGAEAVELLAGRVSGYPAAALQLSHAQYQSGDLEAAIETIAPFAQMLLAAQPEQRAMLGPGLAGGIALEYGRLLLNSGRAEDALPHLELATELTPDNKQPWQSLGQALAAAGRREEARAALDRFQEITRTEVPSATKEMQLRRDAEDPTGRQLREAMKLLGQGRPEEALRLVAQEAELAPADPRPRLVESRILMVGGRHADALAAAERAAAIAPDSADAAYQRGVVLMALDRLDEAEAGFRRALELTPDHTATMNDLAVLLMNDGRADEARTLLQRALEIRPEDPVAAANLARLEQEAGQ